MASINSLRSVVHLLNFRDSRSAALPLVAGTVSTQDRKAQAVTGVGLASLGVYAAVADRDCVYRWISLVDGQCAWRTTDGTRSGRTANGPRLAGEDPGRRFFGRARLARETGSKHAAATAVEALAHARPWFWSSATGATGDPEDRPGPVAVLRVGSP